MAKVLENKELNCKVNKSWRDNSKDGRKLWKQIDWNGKANKSDVLDVPKNVKYAYFSDIFQSEKNKRNAESV